MENKYVFLCSIVILISVPVPSQAVCDLLSKCPSVGPDPTDDSAVCVAYPELENTLVRNSCVLEAYEECYNIKIERLPLSSCIKAHFTPARRFYGESCPVFCPEYYRPVCGASKFRDYQYRTFINGCYLDMINCRGYEDAGYTEVSLDFCQRHHMKNIWKEQIVVAHLNNDVD